MHFLQFCLRIWYGASPEKCKKDGIFAALLEPESGVIFVHKIWGHNFVSIFHTKAFGAAPFLGRFFLCVGLQGGHKSGPKK